MWQTRRRSRATEKKMTEDRTAMTQSQRRTKKKAKNYHTVVKKVTVNTCLMSVKFALSSMKITQVQRVLYAKVLLQPQRKCSTAKTKSQKMARKKARKNT